MKPIRPHPILVALVTGSLMLQVTNFALAADITFATGQSGRAYWGVGERLRSVAEPKGLDVSVVETQGSMENLQRLADPADPVNLVLTQADALHAYVQENPGFGNTSKLLESIGLECVFALAAADGPTSTEAGWLAADAPRVALSGPDSGATVTHLVMTDLIPELKDDVPVYMTPAESMSALNRDDESKLDLVFIVHRAKFRGPELMTALERPDLYAFVPISDKRLSVKLPNGEPVYEFLELPLVRGALAGPKSYRTICTKGMLVTTPNKLSADADAKLKMILDYQWMLIYPEERI